ncbi:MAG: hypothetical protein AB1530_06820 [Candidatus Omnitrophota bacterium]
MRRENSQGPQNCWEFWQCSKEVKQGCRAFKNDLGRYCWLGDSFHPKSPKDFTYCWDCPWYKKAKKTIF